MLLPYYEKKSIHATRGNHSRSASATKKNRRDRLPPLVLVARILGFIAAATILIRVFPAAPHVPNDPLGDDALSNPIFHPPLAETIPVPLVNFPVVLAVIDSPLVEATPPPIVDLPVVDPSDPSVAAHLAVDALYARQSKTLAQASARYSLRTKRAPPPNYDLWFHYAQERQCLIDDYDQIHRDFKPFYQLADTHPAYFQEMIDRAHKLGFVEVRDGVAFSSGATNYFSAILPDMSFLINSRDGPRVAFNFRAPSARKNALLQTDPNPFHIAPTGTSEFFASQSGCILPTEADGFMDNINDQHSFLIASTHPGYTTDLYPVLSMSKVSPCFADILFPTEYYYERSWWSGKYGYPDNIPWDDKKPQLYWRGTSTGGIVLGDNYHTFMRFKLADMGRAHPDLMDVAITLVDPIGCREDLGCDAAALAVEYDIREVAPAEKIYQYKYAVDVDGEAFSGRFLGLLRSGSLVFKATLFEEYFNDWLRPYEHYVPVKPDLSDLVQQLSWANENPEEARLIQRRGQAVAQRVLTDEQNDCYFSAVLLEYARLQEYARTLRV
ncbi:glycosyl transferase family 90-domain-containing protein [Mycena maculata]|uniref:Glycosyl transferase family 90-domain-containing protein n=1 Tax=Mycena maculata TaxID=230809 RepID=A0AAD7JIJ0_9AGAR|nr:glycosyl transferase family 90-domain-containing protein [Mycena maculata]